MWISGIVVAFGCTLEFWEVAFDLTNWWRYRKRRDTLPDNPGSWRYPLAALGLFLVVFGIFSETVCEVLVSNAESQLRAHISEVLSTAEMNAAAANGKATDAQGKIALLDKERAALETEAAEAKLDTARLESQIQPRSYTPTEIAAIDRACKPLAGTAVVMRSLPYDIEGAVFGSYLGQILAEKECGMAVNSLSVGNNFMQNLPLWMNVHVTGPPEKQPFVNALAHALNTPRVETVADPASRPGTPIVIFVGAKRISLPE